jgi:acetylornithine/N-succinyldiaminopimelate aminotransferase
VAILVEPVQGEGGIHIPADMAAYMQGLRKVCDDNGWLLMLDEVQSGIGRTGTWFAFQHTDILPDVMTLAKGLGSGVPIGACLARGIAAETFVPGKHGSTFGGNPLATTAGLTTLDVIANEKLRENAEKMGDLINQLIKDAFKNEAGVKVVRNAGLMVGIELDRPCSELVKMALEAHLLINVTAEKVVRLLPPLVINEHEVRELVSRLAPLIMRFLHAQPLTKAA